MKNAFSCGLMRFQLLCMGLKDPHVLGNIRCLLPYRSGICTCPRTGKMTHMVKSDISLKKHRQRKDFQLDLRSRSSFPCSLTFKPFYFPNIFVHTAEYSETKELINLPIFKINAFDVILNSRAIRVYFLGHNVATQRCLRIFVVKHQKEFMATASVSDSD